ncbi:SAM-dependent methyltransferase [Streptomyces sp. M10(2022)]
MIDAAKIPYGRFMAQEAINQALIDHAKAGKAVVRLKGGDPFVFGRGMEEAQALAAEGIACTVVPGISSSISVRARPGFPSPTAVSPMSSRWSAAMWRPRTPLAGRLGGHRAAAGNPRPADGRRQDRSHRPSAHRPRKVPETPVALVQEGTTAAQRRVDATLATAGERAVAEDVRPGRDRHRRGRRGRTRPATAPAVEPSDSPAK